MPVRWIAMMPSTKKMPSRSRACSGVIVMAAITPNADSAENLKKASSSA
jgi:hypothetical protein